MILLRSLAFQAVFIGWTLLLGPLFLPLMLLPRRVFAGLCAVWARGALAIARVVAGIRYELRGRENLPAGPVVVASKHQSAYETLLLYILFPDCCYVLKRELFRLPFVGWFLWRVGMVGIDRGGKARAMIAMLERVRARNGAARLRHGNNADWRAITGALGVAAPSPSISLSPSASASAS